MCAERNRTMGCMLEGRRPGAVSWRGQEWCVGGGRGGVFQGAGKDLKAVGTMCWRKQKCGRDEVKGRCGREAAWEGRRQDERGTERKCIDKAFVPALD